MYRPGEYRPADAGDEFDGQETSQLRFESYFLGKRGKLGRLLAQSCRGIERRDHVLSAADECRNRITRQCEDNLSFRSDTEPHRLARALADFVEDDLDAQRVEHFGQVVGFAHRHATAQHEYVAGLQERYGDRIHVIGVLFDDTPENGRVWLRERGTTYPTVRELGSDLADEFWLSGLPYFALLTPERRLSWDFLGAAVGPGNMNHDSVTARLDGMLGSD